MMNGNPKPMTTWFPAASMGKTTWMLLIWMVTATQTFAEAFKPPSQPLQFSSSWAIVPVMANGGGQGGAFFQTRVSLMNPTTSSYPIEVTLYGQNGMVGKVMIEMASSQVRNYGNFLEEVFGFAGAGAIKLTTDDPGHQFLVLTEVYVESPTGSYGTTVPSFIQDGSNEDAFSLGVTVDSTSRTNLGCFNDTPAVNGVHVSVFDASGNQLANFTMSLPPNSWAQIPLSIKVAGGFVWFRPTRPALCYAVTVDNLSHDGRFAPAVEYSP